ncbi:hypothetical protein Ddc_10019 [Ditylenchus destructor]|nr:hypothetical protein Ddc_10019 [Ditylenchus destructor]
MSKVFYSLAYLLLIFATVFGQKSGNCIGKDGKDHKDGEEFSVSHLRYKCTNSRPDILGCQIDANRSLKIGQDHVQMAEPIELMGKKFTFGVVYRCFVMGDGSVAFQEYGCGFRNTPSCTPPAKPFSEQEYKNVMDAAGPSPLLKNLSPNDAANVKMVDVKIPMANP